MIDYTDPATATQRLSHGERDDAVAALSQFAAEGRLTDAEAETRAATARVAVTRGDLAPLFADLPVGTPSAAGPAAAATPAFAEPQSGGGTRQRSRRYAVVALMPFIALALFFIFGNVWGFSYAWLWFLLVPIAGIVVYGAGGYSDRDR